MAHYAELNENNVVTRVLVLDDTWSKDEVATFLTNLSSNTWVETSYTGQIHGHYAGIGDTFNTELKIFIAPKPFNSWLLDVNTGNWLAPVDYPTDGQQYRWDESQLNWVLQDG